MSKALPEVKEFVEEFVEAAAKANNGVAVVDYSKLRTELLEKLQIEPNTNKLAGMLRRARQKLKLEAPPQTRNVECMAAARQLRVAANPPKEKPMKLARVKAKAEKPQPTTKAAASAAPKPAPAPVALAIPAPPPAVVAPPPPPATRVGRATPCQWPFGEPGTRAFRFCGEPCMRRRSFCEEHEKVVYVRVYNRREDPSTGHEVGDPV